MRTCRSRLAFSLPTLLVLIALGAPSAQAGMFDDDEARQQIKDLKIQHNERLETLSKGQFDLLNQVQALREEHARLRGQIETLVFELESAKKRQQDFYIDLDARLRKLETAPASAPASEVHEGGAGAAPAASQAETAPKSAAADPAVEARDYEAALNLFKANKLKEAASAFEAFGKYHPNSTLAPNAQYWLGNTHYALRDCKKSVESYKFMVGKWPQHAKAADSLVGIATCQQEQGDVKAARATLESVLARYPASTAAATARQRLKK